MSDTLVVATRPPPRVTASFESTIHPSHVYAWFPERNTPPPLLEALFPVTLTLTQFWVPPPDLALYSPPPNTAEDPEKTTSVMPIVPVDPKYSAPPLAADTQESMLTPVRLTLADVITLMHPPSPLESPPEILALEIPMVAPSTSAPRVKARPLPPQSMVLPARSRSQSDDPVVTTIPLPPWIEHPLYVWPPGSTMLVFPSAT